MEDFLGLKARDYESDRNLRKLQEETTRRAVELLHGEKVLNRDTRLLDLGCGTGWSMEVLRELGFGNVVGLDISEDMLVYAGERDLDILVSDFREGLPFKNNSFGGMISISALSFATEGVKDPSDVGIIYRIICKELRRVLAPGSRVVIQLFKMDEFQEKELNSALLRTGFSGGKVIDDEGLRKEKRFLVLKLRKKLKKKKGKKKKKEAEREWEIKGDRPEDLYETPDQYFTLKTIKKYSKASHMRRTERKITGRILELLDDPDPGKVIDLGCGWGFASELLMEEGHEVVGIDILEDMLEEARSRDVDARLVDMRELAAEFGAGEFDLVVSSSALQWLRSVKDLKKVAAGVYHVLNKKGLAGFQFYARSERELKDVARIFGGAGFDGKVVIDNPGNARKRTVYLILNKPRFKL
jgi:ubiquinone/menaquinone biosynthesis C-methylase UbiE